MFANLMQLSQLVWVNSRGFLIRSRIRDSLNVATA